MKEEKKVKPKTLAEVMANCKTLGIIADGKDVDVVSTGSLTLDIATGIYGYPRGKIVEIFGPESGGKTTMALVAIAQAQKMGKKAAFIDLEATLNHKWAQKLGVDTDALIHIVPDYGEQALDLVIDLIKTNEFDIIVIDSTAALAPKSELLRTMEEQSMGTLARLMSKAMPKLTQIASKTKTTIVFISQVREKIGVMFGNPEVSTGGRALKFFSSMRMRVNVVTKPDAKSGPTAEEGNHIKVKVIKNKCAKPHLEAEFFLNYEKGIDNDREILFAGVEKGIITLDGRTYTFEKWEAVGKERMIKLIQDTPELKASLLEKVKHSMASSSPVAVVDEEVTLEDIEEAASISNKTIEQEMEEEEAADKKKMRVGKGVADED